MKPTIDELKKAIGLSKLAYPDDCSIDPHTPIGILLSLAEYVIEHEEPDLTVAYMAGFERGKDSKPECGEKDHLLRIPLTLQDMLDLYEQKKMPHEFMPVEPKEKCACGQRWDNHDPEKCGKELRVSYDEWRKAVDRIRELKNALALILPMAKGYAYQHSDVQSNMKYIAIAEKLLKGEGI